MDGPFLDAGASGDQLAVVGEDQRNPRASPWPFVRGAVLRERLSAAGSSAHPWLGRSSGSGRRRGARRGRCGTGSRGRRSGRLPSRRRASWSRAGEQTLKPDRHPREVEELSGGIYGSELHRDERARGAELVDLALGSEPGRAARTAPLCASPAARVAGSERHRWRCCGTGARRPPRFARADQLPRRSFDATVKVRFRRAPRISRLGAGGGVVA